ncbi:MAG: serine O-acetyltransferase EpsC [Bacteroidota bacterium]|nr:serine O-acetyltransferase EpsC [Bacteroidota bacterium]
MSPSKSFPKKILQQNQLFCNEVPSLAKTQHFINDLVNFLFPIRVDRNISLLQVEAKWEDLHHQFRELVTPFGPKLNKTGDEITIEFFEQIPAIHERLIKDADAYVVFDPAAKCREEVILCYPGYYALSIYRLSHVLYQMNVPVLSRVISEYAHAKTGIDIHPGANIGKRLFIDHGTGIVIGETTIIGNNVKIYQGVTLGALYVGKELANKKRHPTIQDNVIVYAGSTILGGETIIGHDTVVGGNSWITESVPPFSVVSHKPVVVIRDSKKYVEPINFVI